MMAKLYALSDGHGMQTAGKRTPIFTDGTKSKETKKNFMHENEFNRTVVKYLDAHLRSSGFRTLLVAPTDADTPLATRTNLANSRKADAYISVHANALTGNFSTGGRGIETFVWMTGGSAGAGERLGRSIHKELVKGTKLVDRGVKKGNHLWEIRKTNMPTVLVECGFMDNLAEAKLLLSDEYRRECAQEIAQGICNYEKVTFKPASFAALKGSSDSAANIDTTKGIGLVKITAKTLPLREKPDGNSKLIRNMKAGDSFYAYEERNAWYNLGGGWAYDLNRKSLDFIPHPKTLYRVRKTWSNVASQVGAFYDLNSAKAIANEKMLTVFDEQGKSVHVGKKAEAPVKAPSTPPKKPPEKEPIEGSSEATVKQMVGFLSQKNKNFSDAKAVAEAFLSVGKKYGIRGDVAFCQSIIETGWFKFDGGTAVTPDQHNYCGMGVTSKGMKGNSFSSIEQGVEAQIQHLYAYANKKTVTPGPIVDPRFKYVTRGSAPNWEDLSMKWAMNANYGKHILQVYEDLLKFEVEDDEVEEKNVLDSYPEWASKYAKLAIEAGITDGSRPNEPATRLQMIVMFGRLLEHLKKE